MNKLYSVHDHWTDIDKKNDVDIESIDGVITGIKVNGEDYSGGITWGSVYSGSIDPEGEVSPFTADVSLTMTATNLIKVVYDGVEYVLPKQVFNEKIYYGAVPAFLPADIDFTNYPFLIQVLPDTIKVYTETAGLHTLAISVPQSGGGGSSDFSTAEVTIINTSAEYANTLKGSIVIDSGSEFGTTYEMDIAVGQTITANVIMYKGNSLVFISDVETLSGAIQSIGGNRYLITGDCTITIS